MKPYERIINLSRPVSYRHARMPVKKRAAQFASFAALSGYDLAVKERARWTDSMVEIGEDDAAELDAVFSKVLSRGFTDTVKAVYFVPDKTKAGGVYRTIVGKILKADGIKREIVFWGGITVPIEFFKSLAIVNED